MPDGAEPPPAGSRTGAETRGADVTGETMMTDQSAPARSLKSRMQLWIWGVLHPQVLLRRAIAGVYSAEFARERVGDLEDRLSRDIAELRWGSEETVRALRRQGESQTAADEALRDRVDSLMTLATPIPRRLAALSADVAALAENVGTLRKSLDEQMRAVRAEIMFQQRRLTRLALPVAVKPLEQTAAEVVDQRLELLYAALADVFRGAREDIKQRLEIYLDPLRLAGAGQPDKPILDIGCGRGEFLQLLNENSLHGYGVDSSTIMVEHCASYGLDARHADFLAHLHGIEDASRSAVTAFHVLEHLPFGSLVDFLDEALRVLIPGGLLILETPNPETIRVGATTFYDDPTHRNPLLPEMLRFIVQHRGFAEVEILRLHPFPEGLLQEPTADVAALNEMLFGPQDFAIVGRRP